MSNYHEIDPAGLKAKIDANDSMRLIDVRNQDEWDQGQIKTGEFLTLSDLPSRLNEFDKDVPVIFYCRSGVRSAEACKFLEANTGIVATNLVGGILAWAQLYDVINPVTGEVVNT